MRCLMRFVSLSSSSEGNSALISYKNTNILVDCGLTKKKILESLREYDLTLDDIDYIFITHEHTDHTKGLSEILKNHNIKVISQRSTLIKIKDDCEKKNGYVNTDNFKVIMPLNSFNKENYFTAKDIKVYPIKGKHDVPAIFYKFVLGNTIVAILTDMGRYSEYVIKSLYDVNYLMLECNYDRERLMDSNYPEFLKLRIMGEGGHLSNVDTSEIIMRIANPELKEVYLAHISKDTNDEEYALTFTKRYLKEYYKGNFSLPKIAVAKRKEITEIINIID